MRSLNGKVGLVGDVHQQDLVLAKALERLAGLGVQAVLCTGDIVDGRGDAASCIARLSEAGAHVVRGNHDRWLLEGTMRSLPDALPAATLTPPERAWLAALPAAIEFDTPSGRLLLCHGLGHNDMASLTPDDCGYGLENNDDLQRLLREPGLAMVVAGHTHRRMIRQVQHLRIVNPGTLLPHHQPCYAVADLAAGEVHFHDAPP